MDDCLRMTYSQYKGGLEPRPNQESLNVRGERPQALRLARRQRNIDEIRDPHVSSFEFRWSVPWLACVRPSNDHLKTSWSTFHDICHCSLSVFLHWLLLCVKKAWSRQSYFHFLILTDPPAYYLHIREIPLNMIDPATN